MTTKYVAPGDVMNTENDSGSALSAGDPIVKGAQVRVAIDDIAADATGPCAVEGIWTLTAANDEAWVDGTPLYWDQGNSKLTATAGAHPLAGFAAGAKAETTATADIKLAAAAGSTAETTTAGE